MALVSELKTVILDTNVLISALKSIKDKTDSVPLRILKQFEGTQLLLVTTHKIREEYKAKCQEKINEKLINSSDADYWLKLIDEKSKIGSILRDPPIDVVGDPTDNIFFDSRICLQAKFLVTGNLKHLEPIQKDLEKIDSPLKIISPSDFLKHTTGSFRKENMHIGFQSAYCPICGTRMSVKKNEVTDNNLGKKYDRSIFWCKEDDVWVSQEIPKRY